MNWMKKCLAASFALLLAAGAALPAAAGQITVNEDIAVSDGYDWTRFAGQNLTLNVYNWGLYISDGSDESVDVVSAFEELTGIRVNYTTFDSNESLYAKMKSGGASYDVIFPSEYMVGKMIAEDMLAPLDYANIPNMAAIGDEYKGWAFDPDNAYSVPYMWGTTGLIYNTTMVDELGGAVGCAVRQQRADVQQLPRCLRHRRQETRPFAEPEQRGGGRSCHAGAAGPEIGRAGLCHGRDL